MRQYNPLKVKGSWATPIGTFNILQATIEGEFLTTQMDNKPFARENDLHGNSVRVVQPNAGGQLSVVISRGDPVNAQLSKAHLADLLSTNVVGFLLLNDLNGGTRVACADAFLEGQPDPSFSNVRGSWPWTWQVGNMQKKIAGYDIVGG